MDNAEREELILDAQYHLKEALDAYRQMGEHEDDMGVLHDMLAELDSELVVTSDRLWQEQQSEDRAMTRDYWRSVL